MNQSVLLDTHTLLWWAESDRSSAVALVIASPMRAGCS